MMYVVLIIGILVCGFGWLINWVALASMVLFMHGKGYMLPTEEESKACLKEVWFRVLKIKK